MHFFFLPSPLFHRGVQTVKLSRVTWIGKDINIRRKIRIRRIILKQFYTFEGISNWREERIAQISIHSYLDLLKGRLHELFR